MKFITIIACLFLASCQTIDANAKDKHSSHGTMMVSTWYQSGSRTANGHRFNPNANTVAHRTLPFGTKLRITNPRTKSSLIATVTDRGPRSKKYHLDVSRGIAERLGFKSHGTAKLMVQIIK